MKVTQMKRSRSEDAVDNNAPIVLKTDAFNVVHYRSDRPFPVAFTDDFPAEDYRSRFCEVKTAIHWGQRKLLLSEIQLLSMYARKDISYHIVYAGSAPGTHLGFLDDLFANKHTWELVDPGKFDLSVLGTRKNFHLRNQFFTNETAYQIAGDRLASTPALQRVYGHLTTHSDIQKAKNVLQESLQEKVGTLDVARGTHDIPSMYEEPAQLPCALKCLLHVAMERKPVLFVSDIRSGSVSNSNFELHVAENMKAQQCWTEIVSADFSMLKFRLPYTKSLNGTSGEYASSTLIDSDGTVEYLNGDILLPIWTRPTSTEGRLVVKSDALRKRYNVQHYEDQCFFFNARLREVVHFNHALVPHADLDNHYDAAAEVFCLEAMVRQVHHKEPKVAAGDPATIKSLVSRYVALITKHLKIQFADAIRKRDALIENMAAKGITSKQFYDDDDPTGKGETHGDAAGVGRVWIQEAKILNRAADRERKRLIWIKNIPAVQEAKMEDAPLWNCKQMIQK